MKLNIGIINAIKHGKKQEKYFDGGGLFLLAHPNGSKYWRLNYRFNGKQKTIAIGVHGNKAGQVSLAQARQKAHEFKKQVSEGVDPSQKKKQDKFEHKNAFSVVAMEWVDQMSNKWSKDHAKDVQHTLESNIFPFIGDEPINKVTTQNLIQVLKKIEKRGALGVLKKLRQRCNNICIYAKVMGYIESNPAEGLELVLKSPVRKNFQSIKLDELPKLVNAIRTSNMEETTRIGLLLAMYTFQRTSEIRFAEWREFDFEKALWTIPAERMKIKREQYVPLAKQVIEALDSLKLMTGHFPFVFASSHKPTKQPMSENAMLSALYRMGYKHRMTVHGFRHLASTTLNEMGFDSRWIEKQLSHEDKNAVRGTYNKAEYLTERKDMMQKWADTVDNL